jgi:hypothetical protein
VGLDSGFEEWLLAVFLALQQQEDIILYWKGDVTIHRYALWPVQCSSNI